MSSLPTTDGDRSKTKREHNVISQEETDEASNNISVPKKKKKADYKKQWMKTRKTSTRIGTDYQCNIPALISSKTSEAV